MNEEQEDNQVEWYGQPETQAVLKAFKGMEEAKLKQLLGACSQSQDPVVRAYHAELGVIRASCVALQPRVRK